MMMAEGLVGSDLGLIELQGQLFREARRGGPTRQLMTAVLERRNLASAFERVRSADGANTPGPDGVTCAEVRAEGGWLNQLADDLYSRRYRFSPPRWVEIPKPGRPGEVRRLAILTVRDRTVHAALKQVLEPILDWTFAEESFGFRPGRSVAAALAEAVRRLTPPAQSEPPFGMAVHLDVANCFDTVDHRLLLEELARHVADGNLLRLMEEMLGAGGSTVRNWFWRRGVGLLQGSSLSPLLCNLALHPVDEALRQLGQATRGGVCLLRYADDLLLLARDTALMDQGRMAVMRALGRLRQDLRQPAGTPRPAGEGVDWLGVRVLARSRPWSPRPRFGYVVPEAKVTAMLARVAEITTPPSERIDPAVFNLSKWLVSVNTQLRDWREAYCYSDNATEVFEAIDEQAHECVARLIVRVTGIRPSKLYETYRVRLPRGFSTWQVEGTRLVVLSSLAPRFPGRLVRLPTWAMQRPARPPARVVVQNDSPQTPRLPLAGPIPPALPAPSEKRTEKQEEKEEMP